MSVFDVATRCCLAQTNSNNAKSNCQMLHVNINQKNVGISVGRFTCILTKCLSKQELSYRHQIARQLRTQYAEGIYRLKYYTVTLRSRLRVTQGHWKRNHWIDCTQLSSSRVI